MNILLQTLKDNLKPTELTGLDKENYPCLYPESKQAKNNKGNRCWECMPCCYWNLFIFFNQRCIEALVKSKRQSLDAIKRRMQAASKHTDADAKSPALFKVSASRGTAHSFQLSLSPFLYSSIPPFLHPSLPPFLPPCFPSQLPVPSFIPSLLSPASQTTSAHLPLIGLSILLSNH